MSGMEHREKRPRRSFSPEFKAEVVELCRTGDRSIGEVAKDLDLTETAVREWVRRADVDAGRREGLSTAEREEIARLRRENRTLREERDILKRATARSRGRCNNRREPSSGSLEVQSLPGPRVQPGGNLVQVGLAVHGEVRL